MSTNITLQFALECTLYHDPDRVAFVHAPVGEHLETFAVKSEEFREWLAYRYYQKTGEGISPADLSNALNTFAAIAVYEGGEVEGCATTHPVTPITGEIHETFVR